MKDTLFIAWHALHSAEGGEALPEHLLIVGINRFLEMRNAPFRNPWAEAARAVLRSMPSPRVKTMLSS